MSGAVAVCGHVWWIRGFIAFRQVRRTRIVMLMVPE
jgi:hypothetical protein